MPKIENASKLNTNAIVDPLMSEGAAGKQALHSKGHVLYVKDGTAATRSASIRQSERRHNAAELMHARLATDFQVTSEVTQRILTRCSGMRAPGEPN